MGLKKDEKKVFFEISKYADGKNTIIENTDLDEKWQPKPITMINGVLKNILLSTYEYEGKEIQQMTFELNDWENLIHLQATYSRVSRGIIFALHSLEKIDEKLSFTIQISWKGTKYVWVEMWWHPVKSVIDFENEIKSKTKAVMDWDEFIKYNYSELDARVKDELIPKINSAIVDVTPEVSEKEPVATTMEDIESSDEEFTDSIEKEAEAKSDEALTGVAKEKAPEDSDLPF